VLILPNFFKLKKISIKKRKISRRFLRVWLQSFQKVMILPNFLKIQNIYQKTQNFTLISNPLKKLLKNAPTKSYKLNKFEEQE
jgi:hypothetical protein